MNKNIILIGLILTTQSFSYEKIYKWTDENGLLHYSSKKPENNTSSLMRIKQSKPPLSTSIESQINDSEGDEKIQSYYDQKDERKLKDINRKKQCKYSKIDLADLQSLGKCGWINRETGESYTHISNDKRAEITASLQKKIGKYCQ
jgi:hypothetical protein